MLCISPENRALIGKYALENGNKSARLKYLADFPNLNESTVRNFKKSYKERLKSQRNQHCPQPITTIPSNVKGLPPILMELDQKLITFF